MESRREEREGTGEKRGLTTERTEDTETRERGTRGGPRASEQGGGEKRSTIDLSPGPPLKREG